MAAGKGVTLEKGNQCYLGDESQISLQAPPTAPVHDGRDKEVALEIVYAIVCPANNLLFVRFPSGNA
jgi:hypothetical protein